MPLETSQRVLLGGSSSLRQSPARAYQESILALWEGSHFVMSGATRHCRRRCLDSIVRISIESPITFCLAIEVNLEADWTDYCDLVFDLWLYNAEV